MSTVAEISVAEEFNPLMEIAAARGWRLERRSGVEFSLGLPRGDGLWSWLLCRCDRYPAIPPAWHWCNPETGALDNPADAPATGGFFHSNHLICAPWNRLAYKSENPKGPHAEWVIGNWRSNPRNGACRTLAAMALRIAVELQKAFPCRRGA